MNNIQIIRNNPIPKRKFPWENCLLSEQALVFFGCSESIQFLINPVPSTQSERVWFGSYHLLCSICFTYGMSCHAIGHQVLPNPLSREAEDFPQGCKYLNNVPLSCNQFNQIRAISIYTCQNQKKKKTFGEKSNHPRSSHLINNHQKYINKTSNESNLVHN